MQHTNQESFSWTHIARTLCVFALSLFVWFAPTSVFAATTTLSSGTDPSSFTIAPGSTATSVDAFIFQTDAGSDTITAVTLMLPSVDVISMAEVVNETGSTVYGTTSTFTLNATTTGFESGTLGSFTAGGDAPFTATSTASNQGSWSAVSGLIGDSASSTISYTKVFSGAGAVQFSYKTSSEEGYDYLTFFIDGSSQGSWTGLVDWSTSTAYAVTAGTHTFMWSYTKDDCCTDGTDQVWIDDVTFSEGYVATVALSNATFAVSTSATTSKVRLTPKTHAALAPAAYTTGASVSGWTGTNTKDGSDSSATILSIDNVAPSFVTGASVTGGSFSTSTYTTPADTDLSRVIILRSTSVVVDAPVDGTTYNVNDTIGAATVACVDTGVTPSTSDECVATGLSSTTPYYIKIFTLDLYGNYGSGVSPTGSPINIQPITISGTLYSDEGVTPIMTGKTIKIAVGTSTVGVFSTSTNASGVWSVTLPVGHEIAVGTPVLVFVDGDSSTPAASVTKAKDLSSHMTDLALYKDRLVIAHEATAGVSVSNADLSFYDWDNDADVPFTSNAGVLSIVSGIELHVRTGKTFDPSGSVVIHSNASASSLDGTLHLAPGSIYVSSGATSVGGNLFASSTASITGVGTLLFTATTTGKVIMATSTSIGSVHFVGDGGSWTFAASATTTNFLIDAGASVTAPSSVVTILGSYQNDGAFTHNSGTAVFRESPVASFAALDADGSADGSLSSDVYSVAVKGNYLYAGKHDDYTGTCSQVAGSAWGCELMVFDISSSTNPVYVAGRDQQGSAAGTVDLGRFRALVISGDYLFVGKDSDTTPCSQTPGAAIGCELQVYDISSSTNPVYVAGRDSTGDGSGTGGYSFYKLAISGNQLFVGKAGNSTACSQVAGSAIGCELMFFDITDPTNPTYTAGRDMNGSANGSTGNSSWLGVKDVFASGNYLYVGKGYDSTACSQVAGSALGCELMIYDVSSSTNPVYVAGRDASGSSSGTQMENIFSFALSGDTLFVGKDINNTTCTQTAGSAVGCELMVFDISSSTNPVYKAGRDVSGNSTLGATLSSTLGSGLDTMVVIGTTLVLGYDGNSTLCQPALGKSEGCELQMFDISSTTNPRFLSAYDTSMGFSGISAGGITSLVPSNGNLYVGKATGYELCISTFGLAGGCEIIAVTLPLSGTALSGSMNGSNAWNALSVEGAHVVLSDSATTTTFTSSAGSVLATFAPFSIKGNFTNNGTLDPNDTMYFDGTTAQNITGSLTGFGGFKDVVFRNSGTKTIGSNASTSNLTIESTSGAVTASGYLSVDQLFSNGGTFTAPASTLFLRGDYANQGTFTHSNGTVVVSGPSLTDFVGMDTSGSKTGTGGTAVVDSVVSGNYLYIGTGGSLTACSQVAGSAVGCELQVYDVSSSTNPVYVAGREAGSPPGATNQSVASLAVSGNFLFLGKEYGNSTPCTQVESTAQGCELMVFDISSSTNPVYVAGRDISGSADGANVGDYHGYYELFISGTTLYAANSAGSSTPCSNIPGNGMGCEIHIYDISSSTNPVYVAGRDGSGSATGTAEFSRVGSFAVSGSYLYVGKDGSDSTPCSQVSGFAENCELQVYDISSSTNPVYVAGQDASGIASGTAWGRFEELVVHRNMLYLTKYGNGSPCAQVSGDVNTLGCALMVFDISSSTNPVYVAGRGMAGGAGAGILSSKRFTKILPFGDYLFLSKQGDALPCTQVAGFAEGCELQVYDISSTTNPLYVAGRDSLGTRDGADDFYIFTMAFFGSNLYFGKSANTTACSQVASSSYGCELGSLRLHNLLSGTMTGTSAFHDLTIANTAASGSSTQAVRFNNIASSTGLFTMRASTSVQFLANATSSFQNISLEGAAGRPVYIRSSATGTRATFLVLGSQTQVTYADVMDSNACPTTITNTGGIDAGNNLCWTFAPAVFDPTLALFAYRFRNDDGVETGATAHADENASSSDRIWKGDRMRMRVTVDNTGADPASNFRYRLQYASGSCSVWTDVVPNASSSDLAEWKMDYSQWMNDGASTGNLGLLSDPGGRTFTPGEFHSFDNQTGALTLASGQFTELEYAFASTYRAAANTTYCFRLNNQGSTNGFTYSVVPQILLSARPRPQQGGVGIESISAGVSHDGGTPSGGGGLEGTGGGAPVGGGGQGGGGGLE